MFIANPSVYSATISAYPNVLLDAECNIVAVINWEFIYGAPDEYTHSPPWWLLIEMPEYWPAGLVDWSSTYESRLPLFLKALEAKEQEMIAESRLVANKRLSACMREYWDRGELCLQGIVGLLI